MVLNGAEERLQLVLGKGRELLYSQEIKVPAQGMKYLPLAIERCFQIIKISPSELEGIACVRGPGAFTGLRVVLAIATGLSKGGNIPMAGLDYLSLLAQEPCLFSKGEVWVCSYARQDLVYLQGFKPPEAMALTSPHTCSIKQAVEYISQRETKVYLLGSGVRRHYELWKNALPYTQILDEIWDSPSINVLLLKGSQAKYSYEPIQPLYLRPSDAEANLPQIAAERGIDLAQVHKHISDY